MVGTLPDFETVAWGNLEMVHCPFQQSDVSHENAIKCFANIYLVPLFILFRLSKKKVLKIAFQHRTSVPSFCLMWSSALKKSVLS